MVKRTHQQIRKAILDVLSDGEEHSYGDIERKVNTNWQTVRNHCADLKLFEAVTVTKASVKITKEGRALLKKL